MKLTTYDKRTLSARPKASVHRTVNANRKNGFFTLSVRLFEDLGLQCGERALIARDEDSRNDWYITFGESAETGAKLRVSNNNRQEKPRSMKFNNKAAAVAILDSVKAESSATFLVATKATTMPDGSQWYRILTTIPHRKN